MPGPFTYTAAGAASGAQPKGHNVGVQAAVFTFSMGNLDASAVASGTGLTLIMGKIAPRTRILAVQRNFAAGAGNDFVANVGLDIPGGNSLSAFGSATGIAGVAFLTKGLPHDVTISDDANPRWATLKISVPTATSLTLLGTLSLTVFLTNDLS